jgi:hypothetical protein
MQECRTCLEGHQCLVFLLGGAPTHSSLPRFAGQVVAELKLGAGGEDLTLPAVQRSAIVGGVKDHYFTYDRLISLTVIWVKLRIRTMFPIPGETPETALVNLLRAAAAADDRGAHDAAAQSAAAYLRRLQSGVHSFVTRQHEQALRRHMFALVDRSLIVLR